MRMTLLLVLSMCQTLVAIIVQKSYAHVLVTARYEWMNGLMNIWIDGQTDGLMD